MSKPNIIDVLEIKQMKAEAAALYDEIDRRVSQVVKDCGYGRFDYDLEKFLDEHSTSAPITVFDEGIMRDGRYLKFEVVDNIQAMKDGADIWKSVAFKPISFKVQPLKRAPSSLK